MAFSDSFTRADEDLEDSADWTIILGTAAASAKVRSNVVEHVSAQSSGAYHCPDQGSADHYTQVAMNSSGGFFIGCRLTDGDNFIGMRHTSGFWQIYKRDAGAFTQLGSDYSATLIAGDTAYIEGDGNDITFKLNGVARIGPITDSFNNTETRQGILPRSTISTNWFDNFEAGALVGGPTTYYKTITGGITPIGALSSTVAFALLLTGSITMLGNITKKTFKNLLGSSAPSGAITKKTFKTMSGSITPSGSLVASFTVLQAIAGSILMTGAVATIFMLASAVGFFRQIYSKIMKNVFHSPINNKDRY